MTPEVIAEKSAEAMWAEDHASRWFGFALLEVRPGYAKMQMRVEKHHCNGHGLGHGGVSFALADSCFAFACNSYNERNVGQHNMISFLRPVFEGDTLTAEAREVSRGKRSGIYDITITNQDNKKCAEMRGFSHRIDGTLF